MPYSGFVSCGETFVLYGKIRLRSFYVCSDVYDAITPTFNGFVRLIFVFEAWRMKRTNVLKKGSHMHLNSAYH